MNFAQPFQDYEILDRLGAGAMGTVFKARHKKLGRIVALKVLKPSLARDERYVDRLRREARIVASLNHPNVVAGYDLGEEGGYHFFVMELAEGKSLRSLLAEWGMFAEQQVLSVGTQVAAALDHAFQRGVIHRDVKPGNILIDDKGNVKLTDMGLAKGPTDLTLTKDGATVGTPQYISPEQARNPQEVDIRSDLYSLGATLYHMATGQPPFRAETLAELITKVLSEQVRSPQDLNPELSAGLSLVIRKLLAKDLTIRYQTPRELLDDLERVGRNEAPVVDAGSLDEGERAPARRSLLRGAVALGLLLAVLAGAWVGSQVRGNGNGDAPADTVYQQRLDQDLAGMRTMGERWVRLRMAGATAPVAASVFLREREAQVLARMQLALDDAVQSLKVERWAEVNAWLCDPNRWPSAADFARDKLGQTLHEVVGLAQQALPEAIDRTGIDELQKLVEDQLARRDEELLRELDSYVAGPLANEIQELLGRSDFAAAEKRWDGGLQAFTEGKAPGLMKNLPDALRLQLRTRYTDAHDTGVKQVQRSEQEAAAFLQTAVEEGLSHLQERQREGAPWSALSQGLATLRAGVARLHPPPGHFRQNPWPQVEQRLQSFEQKLDLMQAEAEPVRLDWYLDMAYRTLCAGGIGEAAELLRVVTIEEQQALRDLQHHREAIEAANDVATAILTALERSGEPPQGFPRNEALRAVTLRVQRTGEQRRLYVELTGAPPREAMLTEFLLPDLIARADRAGTLRDLTRDGRARGELVLAMAADDLSGLPDRLRTAGDPFLLEKVWPRIRRLRSEPGDRAAPDRTEVWLQVVQAWNTAQGDKALAPLAAALAAFDGRFRDADLAPQQRLELQRVRAWQRGERARQDLDLALRKNAPAGAIVDVSGGEASLDATVRLGFAALRSLAGEGWLACEQPAQMVRTAPAPAEEWSRKRFELSSGMAAGSGSCACTAVLWLQPAEGDRIWLLEFRGVAVLLAMAQDGSVGAALLDPSDVQRPEVLKNCVRRAFAPFLLPPPRLRAVPGGLHRIGIEVEGVVGRKAKVRVLFEDTELVSEQREVDSRSVPTLRFLPSQVLGVTAVEFRGRVP